MEFFSKYHILPYLLRHLVLNYLFSTFNNICDKDVGNTIADLIEKSILSFEDIENLESVLEMKKKDTVQEVPCNCTSDQYSCEISR